MARDTLRVTPFGWQKLLESPIGFFAAPYFISKPVAPVLFQTAYQKNSKDDLAC